MNELMYNEIMDQPEAISQSLGDLRQQIQGIDALKKQYKRIVLTGSGDAYFAAKSLEYAARKHLPDMEVAALSSQESAQYWFFKESDLVVVMSVSGKTPRTLKAARAAAGAGAFVLGVTANADSPLGQISNAAAVIPFKSRSRITPHTTDHLTTLLALSIIIETLAKQTFKFLDTLSENVSEILKATEEISNQIGSKFAERDDFYFLGSGPSFGVALYAAGKFWEASGINAFYSDLEEVGHGLHLILKNGDPLFMIAPSGKCAQRAANSLKGMQELKVDPVIITDQPDLFQTGLTVSVPTLEEEWSPFFTSLPLQWICFAIANAKGYNVAGDGRFVSAEAYQNAVKYMRAD